MPDVMRSYLYVPGNRRDMLDKAHTRGADALIVDLEDAARRELCEETGLDSSVGRWVWTRRHVFLWNGQWYDQYERFFVAIAHENRIRPKRQDSYVIGYRWWSLQDIQASSEEFAPRRLARFLPAIIRGDYPDPPTGPKSLPGFPPTGYNGVQPERSMKQRPSRSAVPFNWFLSVPLPVNALRMA
jgi:8-oxo-dGTP pyrophosphatase MutT (NUDIX family)